MMDDADAPLHDLIIERFKTVLGFRSRCSCGHKLRTVRNCNGPGMRYGLIAAREDWEHHCATARRR